MSFFAILISSFFYEDMRRMSHKIQQFIFFGRNFWKKKNVPIFRVSITGLFCFHVLLFVILLGSHEIVNNKK